jgi:hypothetical protein
MKILVFLVQLLCERLDILRCFEFKVLKSRSRIFPVAEKLTVDDVSDVRSYRFTRVFKENIPVKFAIDVLP